MIFNYKKCFTCKKPKLLIQFHINHMKYKLPSDKGKMVNCRLCECKTIIRNNGNVIRYNFNIKKFEIITIKPTIINLIKEYFK